MDLLNTDHNHKRKTLKNEFALKLDRYVTILEYQANGYREQITELEANKRFLNAEVEELHKQLKDQSALVMRFRKKCGTQVRDMDINASKVRYLEKENKKLKDKLKELKDDFNLENLSDLDENDKLRLVLEVEREMQDSEREKQMQTRLNATKNSQFDIMTEGGGEPSEKEMIGVDDQQTSTEDLVKHLQATNQYTMRNKGEQTDLGQNMKHREIQIAPHQLEDLLVNHSTDTSDLVQRQTAIEAALSSRKRRLTII